MTPFRSHRMLWALSCLLAAPAACQTVSPTPDPAEKPGDRPYEMVWARRKEPAPPTLAFDNLQGWRMEVSGEAQAVLQVSRAQNVWDRPVGKLRYRGSGQSTSKPRILLFPPTPIVLPENADSVDMWVFGNRWGWVDTPGTPPLRVALNLKDADGKPYYLLVDEVRWEEWWLLHRKLPAGMRFPVQFENVELAQGWQPDWREVCLDSVRFYKETTAPLQFAPRPSRNLTLFDGQSAGANTGRSRLPFPTREQTILPMQMSGPFRTVVSVSKGSSFTLTYLGKDCRLRYEVDARKGLSGIRAFVNDAPVGALMTGAGVVSAGISVQPALAKASLKSGVITAAYADGTTLRLRLWQKSLVVDVLNRTGKATELRFGEATGLTSPRTLRIPLLTYGGADPTVLISDAGKQPVFTSLWPDWYRSNGSELYSTERMTRNNARINGGVRYNPRTDGKRNPMFERLFLTVSPTFEEVLPTVPNPVGLHARQASERLWQESWGPDDFAKQAKRSEMIRGYGIEKLIQCNHEISWRDGGESFTVRLHAAPKKGGDEAQRKYVAHQRGLGWYSGLYTNYTDFAPVNEHWSPDNVQRGSDGEWRSAWPRCWALKPLSAVQFDAELAPQIAKRYGSDSSYTDVHTAVAPWGYNDYDARVPGAGTFAQTFYAYGELLRHDSLAYGGPIFSEGTYQWLYAGLADGNYGHAYNGRSLGAEPLLPVFDLYQIHSKECDIGVSWTTSFCDSMSNWRAPDRIDYAIDRMILHTLAYGHIGWLVEEEYGIGRTCRSYYMLQQVQARYGLKQPTRVAYWDGNRLCTVSEAVVRDLPTTRRQMVVEYPGGLKLWLNDHPSETWRVRVGTHEVSLPPAGWAAAQQASPGAPETLFTYSGQADAGKTDYLRSADYTYLDGRGRWFSTPEARSNGALAISPLPGNRLRVIRVNGDGEFAIRRPYGRRGLLKECVAYDTAGKRLSSIAFKDSGEETWIAPADTGVRYELTFTGKPTWSAAPARAECAPGAVVELNATAATKVTWTASSGSIHGNRLSIPDDAPIGSIIRLRASAGNDVRETQVRVCRPVDWRVEIQARSGRETLVLHPTWRVAGLARKPLMVRLTASEGWQVSPARFTVLPDRPRTELTADLISSAAIGAEGDLTVSTDASQSMTASTWRLKRTKTNAELVDLASKIAQWGLDRRKQAETSETEGSGAVCYPTNDLVVGGISKAGIFMHPPYNGGVGYTWAELSPVTLPNEPCELHAFVGIKDGGNKSDGVVFKIQALDANGKPQTLAEQTGVQGEWREIRADLAAFAGKRVRLRLIADVGPNDDSVADWASWGAPVLRLSSPRPITEIAGTH